MPIEPTEVRCERLARRGRWLWAEGVQAWPDGTVSEGYAFVHALYQEVVSDRLTAARRRRLHQRLGEALEQGYHGRTHEIAAALAMHFE
jgi:predicted ATPase